MPEEVVQGAVDVQKWSVFGEFRWRGLYREQKRLT